MRHTCYRDGGYSLWSALRCDACAVALMEADNSKCPPWTPTALASALTTYYKTGAIPADESEWLPPSIFDLERTQRLAARVERKSVTMPLAITMHPEGSFSVTGERLAGRAEIWIDDDHDMLAIGIGDDALYLLKDEVDEFAALLVATAKAQMG